MGFLVYKVHGVMMRTPKFDQSEGYGLGRTQSARRAKAMDGLSQDLRNLEDLRHFTVKSLRDLFGTSSLPLRSYQVLPDFAQLVLVACHKSITAKDLYGGYFVDSE